MKARPLKLVKGDGYQPCTPEQATHVQLNMPGPLSERIIAVTREKAKRKASCWYWNGKVNAPTLEPKLIASEGDTRCSSIIRDGLVQFLHDCTHKFANATMPLLDVEEQKGLECNG